MEFLVLGPLEVRRAGHTVGLTRTQRVLLALLLCQPGKAVSTETLSGVLWAGDDAPGSGKTLQIHVHRLRKALGDDHHLRYRPPGYALMVGPEQLDALRFEHLAAQGRAALAAGDTAHGSARLRQALALWRGAAYADLHDVDPLRDEAARLEERRLTELEACVNAELAMGHHAKLLPELTQLVKEHPLRERFHELLMIALYRSGRRADALAAYQNTRQVLVRELGLEPGRRLQQLQRQVLVGDPALDLPAEAGAGIRLAAPVPAAAAPPRELPVDVPSFTGRHDQLAYLEALLGGGVAAGTGGTGGTGPVAIVAIDGAGGVGKSALAIHAAHRLAEHYPDGQLYVDLHGATAGLRPLAPLEVLGRFLRAIGVDGGKVPGEVAEAAARFRSLLSGRRVLVVLDNARDAAQVAPLLPAAAGCGVLITSRRVLTGLDTVNHLHLDVLSLDEAVALLGRLVGAHRLAAEPNAAERLARLCGCLPLALRIAGARLAVRPAWRIQTLVDRLDDIAHRLDELELTELGLRASFALSVRELATSTDPLDQAAAEAFPLLGLVDGPDLGVHAAARLLDRPCHATERILERLVDAHLIETPCPGRYRLHDLLRLYARELAADHHPQPDQAAALTRVFGWYAATAWRTLALLRPGDQRLALAGDYWARGGLELGDVPSALAWLEAERANLVATATQAAGTPDVPGTITTRLAQGLFGFFLMRSYWADWVRVNQAALTAATRLGDLAGQARAHNDLGVAWYHQGRYAEALAAYEEGLAIWRGLGDRGGQALGLNGIGIVHGRQGNYEQALACFRESAGIHKEAGDRKGQSKSLNNIGVVLQEQRRYDEALACFRESLEIERELGNIHEQAISLNNIGKVYREQGRYDDALACHRDGLALYERLGNSLGQAQSLGGIGAVAQRQGRHAQALGYLRRSLAIYRDEGASHDEAEALRELGVTLRALGRHEEARAHWRQALAIFERLQTSAAEEVRTLLSTYDQDAAARPG